jgi:hypothetical protein
MWFEEARRWISGKLPKLSSLTIHLLMLTCSVLSIINVNGISVYSFLWIEYIVLHNEHYVIYNADYGQSKLYRIDIEVFAVAVLHTHL